MLPSAVTHIPDELLKNFPHTKRVGNYLLGRTIGEGSFAKVKEGLQVVTGEQVGAAGLSLSGYQSYKSKYTNTCI